MAFLTIGGAAIPCALGAPEQDSPEPVGDEARTLSGRTRRVIRGWVRSWTVTTIPMPLADAQALALVLQSPAPLRCGGDLIGATVDCYGSLTALRHQKTADGERAVVEFRLVEAAPSSPVGLLLSARRGLPAGAMFSRGSTAWTILPDGTLAQVAANVPRIAWFDLDGDGVRETPALLLEPAAMNLLRWSEALDNATWGKAGITVSPNATTAPDGQATAHRLTEDTSTGQHLIMRSVSVAAGHQAFSIYLRDNGRRYASLYPQGAASGWAIFDLQAGTVARTGGANLVRAYIDDAIQIAGGVWYRCVVVVDVAAPGTLRPHVYLATGASDPAPNYTGGGTLGVYAWGAQLEASSVASSYVPTAASTASRAADVLTFPWPHAPQPMTGYLRFIERGAITRTGENVLLRIGTSDSRLTVLHNSSIAPSYRVVYRLSETVSAMSALPSSPLPQIGDLVELVWRLYPDGSVQIEQAINGGTPVVAARSSAIGLPSAWSGQVMRLSGVPNGGSAAPAAWLDCLIVFGEWTIPQLRALAT